MYYTVYGSERDRAGTRAALRSAVPHLRSALGREVRLKFLPELEFEEDTSFEEGQKIDALIEELHRKEREG